MPMSKAHIKASRKYNDLNYDRIELKVKKGEKEKIQAHAEKNGESLNGYINRLIEQDMGKTNRLNKHDMSKSGG